MDKKTKPIHPLQFAVINPCCAAIDVGSMLMMVSYSDEQGKQHLLEVNAFTESLQNLAGTLKQAGVTAVAMEATGVYWIVVYEILEQQGFRVTLVNAKHFKNVECSKDRRKRLSVVTPITCKGLTTSISYCS